MSIAASDGRLVDQRPRPPELTVARNIGCKTLKRHDSRPKFAVPSESRRPDDRDRALGLWRFCRPENAPQGAEKVESAPGALGSPKHQHRSRNGAAPRSMLSLTGAMREWDAAQDWSVAPRGVALFRLDRFS
jgi:hypothetical protein